MELTVREELALLKAEVAELRAAAAPGLPSMGHVKEMLFYSTVTTDDQLLVDGEWKVVSTVDASAENSMTISFYDGTSVTWSKGTTVLRRALPARLPARPNQTRRP